MLVSLILVSSARAEWVFPRQGDPIHVPDGLQLESGSLRWNGGEVSTDQLRLIRFPIQGENLLLQTEVLPVHVRQPLILPVEHPLPVRYQARFRIPSPNTLIIHPAFSTDGKPSDRTPRLFVSRKGILVRNPATPETPGNPLGDVARQIRRGGPPRTQDVHLFVDRSTGTLILRTNHLPREPIRFPSDTNPTGFDRLGAVALIQDERLENLVISEWTHNHDPAADLDPGPGQQTLWLQNGDVLTGTLERLTSKDIRFKLESSRTLVLPTTRILEIHFHLPEPGLPETEN
jgi:hypothetical protein